MSRRLERLVLAASAHRNARVPNPTLRPATTPRIAHLSVLINSAVCSVYQRLSSASFGGSGSCIAGYSCLPQIVFDRENDLDRNPHRSPVCTSEGSVPSWHLPRA